MKNNQTSIFLIANGGDEWDSQRASSEFPSATVKLSPFYFTGVRLTVTDGHITTEECPHRNTQPPEIKQQNRQILERILRSMSMASPWSFLLKSEIEIM